MNEITYKATVLGDCGKTHSSIEEWQKCEVCDLILDSRRHKIWFSDVISKMVERK